MKEGIKLLPGFYVFIALGILVVPIQWFAAWLTAAFVHEAFHILFLRMFGYRIFFIEIGMMGAKIITDEHSGVKFSLCALAGPLGGFLLVSLLRIAPRLALCGAVQSLYNLLPVYPLDGGRVMKGLVEHYLPMGAAKRVLLFIENMILVLLCAAALYGAFKLQLGLYPVLLVGFLVFKNKKIPCKESLLRVQ